MEDQQKHGRSYIAALCGKALSFGGGGGMECAGALTMVPLERGARSAPNGGTAQGTGRRGTWIALVISTPCRRPCPPTRLPKFVCHTSYEMSSYDWWETFHVDHPKRYVQYNICMEL